MPGLECTIIVTGELGERFEWAFAGLTVGHEADRTRISGAVIDQAELQGVLRQIFDLGLHVLSITISTSPNGGPPANSTADSLSRTQDQESGGIT